METGAITQYVDVAQLVLYAFWAFFAGLIYYLLRENHREGYPMDPGRENGPKVEGWPAVPEPKVYKLADGREMLSPDPNRADGDYSAQARHGWNGSPLEPVGNPLLAGVGAGAWANRADIPDHMFDGTVKIVPLRVAHEHGVAAQDTDPRGLPVLGADGERAGTVSDMWIDQAEILFRYIEVSLTGGGQVLLPMNFAYVSRDAVRVKAILASQFAQVPALRNPEQVTLLEEEKIMAYYGAGSLYATPERQEPLL
ncbi:photosynthetic reaction center subunit H [Polaromonas sp. YR568]|jgi:photosynthetic reaction center H subunit|uniref:photosynthetic reaction center subunit H n=1 Tax=Polaromonas sp. YR568 TaxID=1855301 RepID=UPI003137EAB3